MTKEVAKYMRWHHEKRIKDDVMRHPADTPAWRKLHSIDESFKNEC